MENNKKSELKQPLYALLVSPNDEERKSIIDGKVTATVREDWRDYQPGPVMLCCHIKPWAVMADIMLIRHCELWGVTKDEFLASGFKTRPEFIRKLKARYPEIKPNSLVTVIKWNRVRGFLVKKTRP